jgi:hypothetical protein
VTEVVLFATERLEHRVGSPGAGEQEGADVHRCIIWHHARVSDALRRTPCVRCIIWHHAGRWIGRTDVGRGVGRALWQLRQQPVDGDRLLSRQQLQLVHLVS